MLAWRASEVAELLDSTDTAVHSVLRRARAQLAPTREDDLAEPTGAELQALLGRYVDAFERADVTALAELLRIDVELEMPPTPTWFTGRDVVSRFLSERVLGSAGSWQMVPTSANSQPALLAYGRDRMASTTRTASSYSHSSAAASRVSPPSTTPPSCRPSEPAPTATPRVRHVTATASQSIHGVRW